MDKKHDTKRGRFSTNSGTLKLNYFKEFCSFFASFQVNLLELKNENYGLTDKVKKQQNGKKNLILSKSFLKNRF